MDICLVKDKIFVLNNGASIRNSKIKAIYFSDIVGRFVQDKIKEKLSSKPLILSTVSKMAGLGYIPCRFLRKVGIWLEL